MSDYDTVRAAVEEGCATTVAERRGIYSALTASLQQQIAEVPPQFRRSLASRTRKLRQAIAEFEQDVRAGVVRAPSPTLNVPPPDPAVSTVLAAAPPAAPLGRVRTIIALTLRFLRHLSRIGPAAAVWLLLEPLIQVSIIVAIYSIIGASTIHDMPPLPFVVLGITAFFMFRMTMIKSALMPIEPALALLPRVRLTDVIASRSLSYMIIYTWALLFFLTALTIFDKNAEVENIPGVIMAWVAVVLLGAGVGLLMRGIVSHVPAFARVAPWINRIFFYSSGVIFVSEQIPDFIAKWLLLNPVLHAVQSIRSAYFVTYESIEVSLIYAYSWALGLIALGLTIQAGRLSRH